MFYYVNIPFKFFIRFKVNFSVVSTIAKRYAKALFALSLKEKKLDAVFKDISKFCYLVENNVKAKRIICAEHSSQMLQKGIVEIFAKKEKIGKESKIFLELLVKNRRCNIILFVAEHFAKMVNENKGRLEVEIVSVSELKKVQIDSICKILKKKYKKEIIARNSIDKDILGGIVIKVGSKMIDLSIASKLDELVSYKS